MDNFIQPYGPQMWRRTFPYDPDVLVSMAKTYLEEKWLFKCYTRDNQCKDEMYYMFRESSYWTLYALEMACGLVGADIDTVIATVKSMNRHNRKQREWADFVSLPTGLRDHIRGYGEDRTRRFFEGRGCVPIGMYVEALLKPRGLR